MSRNANLMQEIMLYLEQQPQGKHIQTSAIQLEGYTHQQIASHVRLLAEDEGLLDITRIGTMGNPDASLVLRITNEGYNFIEQLHVPHAERKPIPTQTIGVLADIMPEHYTHSTIDSLFFRAGAPTQNRYSASNKSSKIQGWLRTVNDESPNPLEVLGAILEDFIEKPQPDSYYYAGQGFNSNEEAVNAYKADRQKVSQSLAKHSLQYSRGGHIISGGATPTRSLQEYVRQAGLKAVEQEIQRALENVEKDPLVAAHNAGCVMEASLKTYLDHHKVSYKDETDTLSNLWQKVVEHIGIHPKEMDDKDLKKIASGLFSIVDGTMHLRNKKSAAHGKSEAQLRQNTIRPRHARLAIHAAHTVSAYVLELLEVANGAEKASAALVSNKTAGQSLPCGIDSTG